MRGCVGTSHNIRCTLGLKPAFPPRISALGLSLMNSGLTFLMWVSLSCWHLALILIYPFFPSIFQTCFYIFDSQEYGFGTHFMFYQEAPFTLNTVTKADGSTQLHQTDLSSKFNCMSKGDIILYVTESEPVISCHNCLYNLEFSFSSPPLPPNITSIYKC